MYQIPLQLYVSVLMFAPTSSAIKRLFSEELPDFISMPNNVDRSWGAVVSGFVSIEKAVDDSQGVESSALENINNPTCFVMSPNGMFFAGGVHSSIMVFQKTTTGISTEVTWKKRLDGLQALAFSSDSKLLATCSRDPGKLQFWDTATGTLQRTFDEDVGNVTSLIFTSGHQLLASPSRTWDFITWNHVTGIQRHTLQKRLPELAHVALSSNGLTLASHCHNTNIDVWNLGDSKLQHTLMGHDDSVTCIALSTDGRLIASGDEFGTIFIWDTTTGVQTQKLIQHTGRVLSITLSTECQLLASSHENYKARTNARDGNIAIWDLNQSSLIKIMNDDGSISGVVQFSPDDKALAAFGSASDAWIMLWDITNISRNQQPHTSMVINIAFSLDGTLLASTCFAGRIIIWDVASESIIDNIGGGYKGLILAFSPNNTLLAVSSSPSVIELWDIQKRQHSSISVYDEKQVFVSAAFSPSGQLIACLVHFTDIKVWDITTNTLIQTISNSSFDQPMDAICFSPNGQYLASSALYTLELQRLRLIKVFRLPNRDERTEKFSFFIDDTKVYFSRDGPFQAHYFPLFELWTPQGDFDRNMVSKWNHEWTYGMQAQWTVYESWVCYRGKGVIYLDDNHHSSCWASNNSTIAIGHSSGGVTFIKVSPQFGCNVLS